MKKDQEKIGDALVSSASHAITKRSSGLVRRGLDDLLSGKSRRYSSHPDKIPKFEIGQKVFTVSGVPAEVENIRDEGGVYLYALVGASSTVTAKLWREDQLTKFDEQKYGKAKILFKAGMKHFESEGQPIADQLRALIDSLRKNYNLSDDIIRPMKPYMLRFMEELEAELLWGEVAELAEELVRTMEDCDAAEVPEASSDSFGLNE